VCTDLGKEEKLALRSARTTSGGQTPKFGSTGKDWTTSGGGARRSGLCRTLWRVSTNSISNPGRGNGDSIKIVKTGESRSARRVT